MMNYMAAESTVAVRDGNIKIHEQADFDGMRKAGRLAAETLDFITSHVVPGVTTGALDDLCREFITDRGAVPAPLNYRGFPKSICTSINHVVCHGIPGPKVLKDGDTLNIDVTVILDGWHGDTSRMYMVGKPSVLARRLVNNCYDAMMAGIGMVRPGATLGDVGHAIQKHVETAGFSVVREYCGHGIGKVYHDEPQVLHYGKAGSGLELKAGMTFTVEPMVNAGKPHTRQLPDGWTVVTRDHSLSAQWEHTLAVTDAGFEILTPWPDA